MNLSKITLLKLGVVAVVAVAFALAVVPNFLKPRERSRATSILNEARMIDAAIDQWAIQQMQQPSPSPSPSPFPQTETNQRPSTPPSPAPEANSSH